MSVGRGVFRKGSLLAAGEDVERFAGGSELVIDEAPE